MKSILDIGQCDHDHGLLTKLATKANANITRAYTAADAFEKLSSQPFDLVWVNRMLDSDNSYGIEIIKDIKNDPKLGSTPVMLVSNFPEAQADAQKVGALAGFGKDGLSAPDTLAKVVAALTGNSHK